MNRPQLAVLNHLLAQQEAIRLRLAEHAGRRIRVELSPLRVTAVILGDGYAGQTDGEPEATVQLASSALIKRATGGTPGAGDVRLSGDSELGLALARILADLRWDAVEDLSRLVGDMAAYRAERWVRGALGVKGEVAWRLANMKNSPAPTGFSWPSSTNVRRPSNTNNCTLQPSGSGSGL